MNIAQTTDDTEPIACSLKPIPLYETLPHVALSYCWGDALNKVCVSVNQQEIAVSSNLHTALLRMRSGNINYIRVDAVCINQDEMEERSIQIGRIAGIYRQAQEVIVWLGEAGDIEESALEEKELATSRSALDISRLLSRDYWNRVWIIQELAAALSIHLLCGTYSMPWHTVEGVVEQNQTMLPFDRLSKIESSNDDGLGEPRANFERILRLRRNQQAGKPTTMFEALYLSAHAQATDARDKLYALLGLAFDGARLVPHPNYNLSTEDVYHQFSSELLQGGYPLDVVHLRSVRRGVESFSPSWVVDWRNLNEKSLLVVFVRISTFLKSDDASNNNVIGNHRAQGALLTAHGVTIGHVQSVDQVIGEGSDQSAMEAKIFVAKCHLQKVYTCSVFQPVKDPTNAFRLANTSASDFQSAVCTQLSAIMGLLERERTSSLRAYLAAHRNSFGKVEEENIPLLIKARQTV